MAGIAYPNAAARQSIADSAGLPKAPAALTRFAQLLLGDPDQMPIPAMTTIGPGAIPLSDPSAYLRRAATESLTDLRRGYQAFHRLPMAGRTTVGLAVADPVVEPLIQPHTLTTTPTSPSALTDLIQRLADAYLPTHLR